MFTCMQILDQVNPYPALTSPPMRRRSPADGTLFDRATCDRVTSCPRTKIWLVPLKMKASNRKKVMAKRPLSRLLRRPPAPAAGPAASSDLSECAGSSQRSSTPRIFVWISKSLDRVGWPLNHWPHHHSMRTSPLNYPQKQCSHSVTGFFLSSVCICGLLGKCWLICAEAESFS